MNRNVYLTVIFASFLFKKEDNQNTTSRQPVETSPLELCWCRLITEVAFYLVIFAIALQSKVVMSVQRPQALSNHLVTASCM